MHGRVAWSTDTLGDFVLLRSSGLPVYNFCVAIDDALMGITHVLRAEEHLPNTLRQVCVCCCGWRLLVLLLLSVVVCCVGVCCCVCAAAAACVQRAVRSSSTSDVKHAHHQTPLAP